MLHTEDLNRAGQPALVFLHGIAGSTASWGAPFRALSDTRRVVLVDALGFGRSPKPVEGAYSVEDHVRALLETLDTLGVARTTLVGHSMGCILALAFAVRFPARVSSLVLLAAPLYRDSAEARRTIATSSWFNRWLALETPLAHFACKLMCHLRPVLQPLMPWFMRDVPAAVARDSLMHHWHSYSRTLQALLIESRPASWLADIRVPVLFVQGTLDAVAPADLVREAIAPHPLMQMETLAAGHAMVFSHADALAARLARWLQAEGLTPPESGPR